MNRVFLLDISSLFRLKFIASPERRQDRHFLPVMELDLEKQRIKVFSRYE